MWQWSLFAAWLIQAQGSGSGACLPDAIAANARKLVGRAEKYPIGVWVNGWPAGEAVAEMMAILIQEAMGYEVEMKGPGPNTVDGFFALTGCADPTNGSDRKCDGVSHTLVHVNVEAWTQGYPQTWQKIQDDYPTTAPRNLGSAGYLGRAAFYLIERVKETAYFAEGLSLDFHREYNISWNDPSKFFASLDLVNVSRLRLCSETTLMEKADVRSYVETTADWDGVEQQGDDVVGKCWRDHFWFAPACRVDELRCIPWFTGGTGWALMEAMQKATGFNMPFALAVAKTWDDYVGLPTDLDSVFYWWEPDPTFLRSNALGIVFPANDPLAWQRGDLRSQYASTPIDTHVSQDLRALSPNVETLLSTYALTIQDVNDIMLDQLDTKESYRNAACRWLIANTARWKKWLPDKTRCFAGFGLYNTDTNVFVLTRDSGVNIECRACPGKFSEELRDGTGITFVCAPCAPGTVQPSGAALSCDPCQKGEYQGESGSNACQRCGRGTYQDRLGQAACQSCPPGTDTFAIGATSVLECGCEAGTINMAGPMAETPFQCEPCGNGLECPFSSSVQGLLQGNLSAADAEFTPKMVRGFVGYTSTVNTSVDVYRCRPATNCPGGQAGSCAAGLQGQVCTRCQPNQAWRNPGCQACQPEDILLWVALMLGAFGLTPVAHGFLNKPGAEKATPMAQLFMTVGLVIHVLQTVAVFGMMAVRWPSSFSTTSGFFQFLVLDLSSSSSTCLTGWDDLRRFLVSVLVFPVLTVWLLLCRRVSRILSDRFVTPWSWPHTLNTIATFLQAGFATMCSIALQPMMCYRHPNGKYSILKYASTFCGDDTQVIMAIAGLALLALFVIGFLALCTVGAWKMPAWSIAQDSRRVQIFRFLTGKFRPDTWWFGILPLLRGAAFSLVILLVTDLQGAQVTLASAILLLYFAVQVRYWPWKAQAINVADLVLNALLLLLVNQSSQEDAPEEEQFAIEAALLIMVLLALSVVVLVLFTMHGFVATRVLRREATSKLAEALMDCAEKLMDWEQEMLEGKLKDFNFHDIKVLKESVAIISTELQDERWAHFKSRVVSKTMNAQLRASIHSSEGVMLPPRQPVDQKVASSSPSAATAETEEEEVLASQPAAFSIGKVEDGQCASVKEMETVASGLQMTTGSMVKTSI